MLKQNRILHHMEIRPFSIRTIGLDILHLIYPEKCLSCDIELAVSEKHICSLCNSQLTESNFHLFEEATQMDQLFWGRTKIESTYAHLLFEKEKSSQNILFSLKYRNATAIGDYFGKIIGQRLKDLPKFNTVDVVIPVPLHPKKEFLRGYNQSDHLARAIASEMKTNFDKKTIRRVRHNETQTRKNRFQRWDNVQGLFSIGSKVKSFQHIMLVDDVITTGSTIDSLATTIRKTHPNVKISVVTLAIA